MRLVIVLYLIILSSCCTQLRRGSPLDMAMEIGGQSVDARENLPLVIYSIPEIEGFELVGIRYRKEPPFSIAGRQIPYRTDLYYKDGTTVEILTLSPLERSHYTLPTGSVERLHLTTVRFGTEWCSWFNGSDVYTVRSEDPLSVANRLIGSKRKIDQDKHQFLWFYRSLPGPDENFHLVEVAVFREEQKRFTEGIYMKDEDLKVELVIAREHDFELPYQIEKIELSGAEFKAGYVGSDYVLVRNDRPVSIMAKTVGTYARTNLPTMKSLAENVVPRIIANETLG